MIMDEGQTLPNVVLATGGAVPLLIAPPIATYAVSAHIAPRRHEHDNAVANISPPASANMT